MSLTTRLLTSLRPAAAADRSFPLAGVEPGRAVVVVALGDDAVRARRLRDLGLVEGRALTVVNQRAEGGVVVAAGDGRIGLDAATAAAVRVRAGAAGATPCRLCDLRPGDRALVRGLREGAPAYRAKLLAMGLLPGTVVEVVRAAPLGDPVELRVRGYQLSLRRAEAEVLELEEIAA